MPGMISGGGDEGGTKTKPLLSGRSQVRLSATREKHGAEQDMLGFSGIFYGQVRATSWGKEPVSRSLKDVSERALWLPEEETLRGRAGQVPGPWRRPRS